MAGVCLCAWLGRQQNSPIVIHPRSKNVSKTVTGSDCQSPRKTQDPFYSLWNSSARSSMRRCPCLEKAFPLKTTHLSRSSVLPMIRGCHELHAEKCTFVLYTLVFMHLLVSYHLGIDMGSALDLYASFRTNQGNVPSSLTFRTKEFAKCICYIGL